MRSLTLGILLLVGCRDPGKETGTADTEGPTDTQADTQTDTQVESVDEDGDGFFEEEDCDDLDASVNPATSEVCDGVDNDCDGLVDDADDSVEGQGTWYQDLDGDGAGNAGAEQLGCEAPTGFVAESTDCDDLDAAFHPGADENDCTDPADYNCDGSVGYADDDGDGFAACEDCDDTVATTSPLGIEVCDGADNNCDGTVDEDSAVDTDTWYADTDGDGYGDAASTAQACAAPAGHVADDTDCDDAVADTHPGGTEACDGTDNDCDGLVDSDDPDVTGTSVYYLDADGDTYGGQQVQVSACSAPAGFVSSSDDCDDLDASSYPGGAESCDGADNDCDGAVDEGVGTTWYEDGDGDGYGNGAVSQESCTEPNGYVANSQDCDDTSATTNPASFEVCDGVDNDCDLSVDEDAINAATFYVDSDGDGYGSTASFASACSAPSGHVANASDCNDGDNAIHPAAGEACDGVDNDCDGSTDEDATDAGIWYADDDGDGQGSAASSTSACSQPSGYVANSTDCDDAAGDTYLGAEEQCDAVDHDCDGDASASNCADCAAILAVDGSSADGVYTIDIDGAGGSPGFEVYCDMTVDGGGWTRFWWFEAGSTAMSSTTDVLGGDLWNCNATGGDHCFASLPISNPTDLLVQNDEGNLAVWTFDANNATSNNVLGAFASQTSVSSCSSAFNPTWQSGSLTDNPYHCDENNNQGSDNCDCFYYTSNGGIYSFYLDDDTGWAETAFGAGYDGSGYGVDSLETAYRYHSVTDRDLALFWR